jgi:hypothetical protein
MRWSRPWAAAQCCSDRTNLDTPARLRSSTLRAASRHGARVRLFYTKVLPNLGQAAASKKEVELADDAVQLRRAGEAMHAKFLGWREKLLITSGTILTLDTLAIRATEPRARDGQGVIR